MSSDSPTSGFLAFVGAGPGDPNLLTLRGAELLAKADAVALDEELFGSFLRHCREGVEVVSGDLVKRAKAGQFVVRLCEGDPMLFSSIARSITEEVAAAAAAEVDFEIVPGVPPATAVLTYAGIPPAVDTPEFRIVDAAHEQDWAAHAACKGTLVIYNGLAGAVSIGKALVAGGKPDSTPVAVSSSGTTTEQYTDRKSVV